MKLTKRDLNQIISEETEKFLSSFNKFQRLDETSLVRVLDKYFDMGFIIISADRSCEAEKGSPCGEEEMSAQQNKNKKSQKSLRSDLTASGFGYIPTYGGFRETVVDRDTGEERLVDNPDPEASFVVTAKKRDGETDVKGVHKLGIQLSKKYGQDSFLFKPPKSEDPKAYWITPSGNVDMTFDDVVPNDLEQIYFTKLRKKPKDRFSLTEAEEKKKQFSIYIPCSPSSVSEARKRYGEIFIRIR